MNLVTGVPDDAERVQRWLEARGGSYLDGAILAYPRDIGTHEAMVIYSGPLEVWRRHEGLLYALGGASRYVSENVAASNVIDVAATGAFYTVALSALVEATSYALARNVTPGALIPAIDVWIGTLRRNVGEAAAAIENDAHETNQATLAIYLEAARSWRQEMRNAGQRASLMSAAADGLETACEEGMGHLGFYAQSRTAGRRAG